METARQLSLLTADEPGMSFAAQVSQAGFGPLTADGIAILQMNITRQCNLCCRHCHVEAGPGRGEMMDRETMAQCLRIVDAHGIETVDITGGAPELHPQLPDFLERVTQPGRRVIVRSNLVILGDPKYFNYVDRFARLGPVRSFERVRSGSPAAFDLSLRDGETWPNTISAMFALAGRGLPMLLAKRTVETLVEEGRVSVDLPRVEDADAVIRDLSGAGIAAALLGPACPQPSDGHPIKP